MQGRHCVHNCNQPYDEMHQGHWLNINFGFPQTALQIYTAGIGTHVKSVKVTSICHRYYHVKV